MKNLKIILIALVVLLVAPSFAQKEYTIDFEHEMTTDDSDMQSMIDMMGDMSTTWYLKGDLFRSETNAGMAGTTIVIYNSHSKDLLMLMENPFTGNMYSKSNAEENEEEKLEYTVIKTNEKKKIAGYKCTKYIITDSEGTETIAYVTDKINNPSNNNYGGKIKGTTLCSITVIEAGGGKMTMTLTATEVRVGAISEDKFSMEIPESYTEMDLDED